MLLCLEAKRAMQRCEALAWGHPQGGGRGSLRRASRALGFESLSRLFRAARPVGRARTTRSPLFFSLRQFEGSIFNNALAAREVFDSFSEQGSHARLGSQRVRRCAGFGHVQSLVANALHNLEYIGAHVNGHGREERTEPAPRMNRDWERHDGLSYIQWVRKTVGVWFQKKSCSLRDNVNMAASKASYMVQKRVMSL